MKPYGKDGRQMNCCPGHDSTSKQRGGKSVKHTARQKSKHALRAEQEGTKLFSKTARRGAHRSRPLVFRFIDGRYQIVSEHTEK